MAALLWRGYVPSNHFENLRMPKYPFLIPVAIAASAILVAQPASALVPTSSQKSSIALASPRQALDPVISEVLYQIGTDEHGLLMKRSEAGEIYAYHRSHRSHRSHSSHRSSSH